MHETWYDYRTAWTGRPWLAAIAVIGAVVVVLGIIGTIVQNDLLVYFFIPGLAVLLAHHLIVRRTLG
ncbi:MAG TPA: hypothetical protein VGN18_02175 [Jatrophihabitans sp.]|uniref:hypothetical protein n=1 Tax=Jatrophihabitans sp. TaxID=1932789 RepID=UPI002E0C13F2|nr:hypothetical protein [Jatrophihabitans sp.]